MDAQTIFLILAVGIAIIFIRAFAVRVKSPTREQCYGTATFSLAPIGIIKGQVYGAQLFDLTARIARTLLESQQIKPEEARAIHEKAIPYRYAIKETVERKNPKNQILPQKTLLFSFESLTPPSNFCCVQRHEWSLPEFEKHPDFFVAGKGVDLGQIDGWNIVVVLDLYDYSANKPIAVTPKQLESLHAYTQFHAKVLDISTVETVNRVMRENKELRTRYDESQGTVAQVTAERDVAREAAKHTTLEGEPPPPPRSPFLSGPWGKLLVVAGVGLALGYFLGPQFFPQQFPAKLGQQAAQQAAIWGALILDGIYALVLRHRGELRL